MKIQKILLAFVLLLLLASNGFLVYTNMQQNKIINDLKSQEISNSKAIEAVGKNVTATYYSVQNVCSALSQC